MSEIDEKAYTEELEKKVTELNKFLEEQFNELGKKVLEEITTFHRKYCQLKNTPEAKACEKDFIRAFITLLEVARQKSRVRGFLVELAVEEIPDEKEVKEDHVHEPPKEDKKDEPGLYM